MIEISIDTNTGKLQEIFAKYPAEAKRMAQEEFGRWAMSSSIDRIYSIIRFYIPLYTILI